MAYHSTSGTATNTADLLVKLKDFLVTTCGWTLHDDGSAQAEPYYVLKSVGESGNEDIYIQIINDTANSDCISVKGYLYWNAATHVGVKVAFSSGATMISTKDSATVPLLALRGPGSRVRGNQDRGHLLRSLQRDHQEVLVGSDRGITGRGDIRQQCRCASGRCILY